MKPQPPLQKTYGEIVPEPHGVMALDFLADLSNCALNAPHPYRQAQPAAPLTGNDGYQNGSVLVARDHAIIMAGAVSCRSRRLTDAIVSECEP
jgi:hypothetical protein